MDPLFSFKCCSARFDSSDDPRRGMYPLDPFKCCIVPFKYCIGRGDGCIAAPFQPGWVGGCLVRGKLKKLGPPALP